MSMTQDNVFGGVDNKFINKNFHVLSLDNNRNPDLEIEIKSEEK